MSIIEGLPQINNNSKSVGALTNFFNSAKKMAIFLKKQDIKVILKSNNNLGRYIKKKVHQIASKNQEITSGTVALAQQFI